MICTDARDGRPVAPGRRRGSESPAATVRAVASFRGRCCVVSGVRHNEVAETDTAAVVIEPGQVWRAKAGGTGVGVIGRDLFRPGRFLVRVHGAEVVTSFTDADLRNHYDLVT